MSYGAIFDLDGTILDSMPVWEHLGSRYLRPIGYEPHPDLDDRLRTLTLPQAAALLQQEYGIAQPASVIVDEVTAMLRRDYGAEIMPKPGAAEFLAFLHGRGVRLCIVTATARELAESALVRCGLMPFFSGLLTCEEAGAGKDHPAIYRLALAGLGTAKAQTVVFEDAAHALQTAKADGFITAAVYDSSEPDPAAARESADWYLPDYAGASAAWTKQFTTRGRNETCADA